MIFGCARVSTDGQSVDAQLKQLEQAGAAKIFGEAASGAKGDSAQLRRALHQHDTGHHIVHIQTYRVDCRISRVSRIPPDCKINICVKNRLNPVLTAPQQNKRQPLRQNLPRVHSAFQAPIMSKTPVPQSDPRPASASRTIHDLHALLYREIGISAVAAVCKITNEARATAAGKRIVHPLPAILQGHDLAA